MNLITATPHAGRTSHIYVADTDDVSLCGRAPHTFIQSMPGVEHVQCRICQRAFTILSAYFDEVLSTYANRAADIESSSKKKGATTTKRARSQSSSRRTLTKSTTKPKLPSSSKVKTRKGITS